MSRSRVLLPVLLCAALLAPAVPAQAASSLLCSGYAACERAGYDDFGYERNQRTSYWRMYTGTNCTNYVAYRLVTTNGMPNVRPKSGVGNARDWGTAMASITDQTPTVGSVAWWGRTGNHVAYVEKVASPTEIIVSESNWGRSFDHRRITKSGSGWPDGFIHFADPGMTNTKAPVLQGRGRVGEPLTATAGSWSPTPTSVRWTWRVGSVVRPTTGDTYVPTEADFGKPVTAEVSASRASFPAGRAATAPLTVSRGYMTPVAAPVVTGTPTVDRTLVASTPTWSPAAESVAYAWTADGEPIPEATGPRLVLDPTLVGRRIAVTATARRTAHVTATASSGATPAVSPGTLTPSAAPAVTGDPVVGGPLTVSPGRWNRDDVATSVTWLVDGVAVPGADDEQWTPRPADVGRTVSARVSVSRDGYTPVTRTVAASGPVAAGELTPWPRPSLPPTAEVGTPLVATVPDAVPTPQLAYAWYVGGTLVPGVTGATFTPRAADVGQPVRVFVTATREGYRRLRLASTPTSPVTRPTIQASTPTLTGPVRPLGTVGVDLGTVTAGATTTYQWMLGGRAVAGATRPTYAVPTSAIGQDLSVRVVHRAPGRTSRVLTSAPATVKALPTVRLATRTVGDDVRVTVTVTARGSSPVPGRVTLAFGAVRRTLTLAGGSAEVVLDRPARATTLTVSYTGSPRVEARRTSAVVG